MAKAAAARNPATERQPLRQEEKIPKDRAVGRTPDGRVVWRRNTQKDNLYNDISKLAPPGMTYEWKTNTIHGMPNTQGMAQYAMDAWEPVMHARHPGLFAPEGTEGPIVVGSSILMERPTVLTEEVRAEEKRAAFEQVHYARSHHKLDGAASDAVNHPSARKATFISESITSDTGPRPQYEIE